MKAVSIIYLISLCIISSGFIQLSYAQKVQNPNDSTRIQNYGCIDYSTTFHCDPLHNQLVGYAYSGSSIRISELTDDKPFFVDGKFGKALEIRAPYREAIHVPSLSNITFNDFSVSFWVKGLAQPEPVGQIVSYTTSNHLAGWYFDMTARNGTSQLIRFVLTNSEGKFISSPDVTVQPNTFHQITGTFNGSMVTIYKDGQLVGETKYDGRYTGSAGIPLTIGSASYCASCNRWSGVIDDLRIYAKTFTSDQIEEIFVNPNNKVAQPLIAHWTFDGQFNDSSGNNNDGTASTLLASMAFSRDGRLFYTEKNSGDIRIMQHDRILDVPFATLSDVYVNWEQGLLGLTLDPDFEHNHFVYVYYSSNDINGNPINKLVRFTEENNKGKDLAILLDNIPASKGYHSGGALAFGPDDKLYVTVGDATEHPFAQDPSILVGKLLRINRDGSIPSDNPFPDSPVYTIGHRNMYGIAFDRYGNGLVSENGDYYYDEINLVKKGGNYGFPSFQPANKAPELANLSTSIIPLRSYWNTIAPTQMIYYEGDKIPLLKDKFVVGTYSGDLYVLRLDNQTKQIAQEYRIDLENYPFKPVVGLAESPTGDLYFGAYSIFKLNATDIIPKRQYLFPIMINSSSTSKIQSIQIDSTEREIIIDVNNGVTNANFSTTNKSNTYPLTLQIPKALIDNVISVVDTERNKPVLFTSNATNPQYNTINIQIPAEAHLQLTLIGSTIATPGEQILRG